MCNKGRWQRIEVTFHLRGRPQWFSGKISARNAGDAGNVGSIPAGVGKTPRGQHGSPLQYSCQENFVDREAWWTTVHEVTKSWTRLKRLSTACQRMRSLCSRSFTVSCLKSLGHFEFLVVYAVKECSNCIALQASSACF